MAAKPTQQGDQRERKAHHRDGQGVRLRRLKVVKKPNGRVFYYYRKPGGALIGLPNEPMDSPNFLKAYAAAEEAGAAEVRKRPTPNRSVSELVRGYLAFRRFTGLRTST